MPGRNLLAKKGRNLLAGPTIPEKAEEAMRQNARDLGKDPFSRIAEGGGVGGLVGLMFGPEANRIGAGSFFNDVGENVQRAGQFFRSMAGMETDPNLEHRLSLDDEAARIFEEERPVASATGRIGAEALTFAAVPGGMTGGFIKKAAGSSLAAGSTALAGSRPGEALSSFSIGAFFGAIAPGVIGGISKVITKLSGKPMQVVVDGKLTDEAIEFIQKQDSKQLDDLVSRELRQSGVMTAEEAKRFNLFKEFDTRFEPTKAQITQGGDDFIRQQELAKGSNTLRTQLDAQEEIIAERVDDVIKNLGGEVLDKGDAGAVVTNAVRDRINAADMAVSDAYTAVRDALPTAKDVKATKLIALLKSRATDNTRTGGMIESVVGDLQRRGLVDDQLRATGRVSIETAEEVRKNINVLMRENPSGRSGVGKLLKDAFDNDVERAVGVDTFAPVRAQKTRLERMLERTRATRRDVGKETLTEKVVANKLAPENLVDDVLSKSTRAEDVGQLFDFLRSGSAAEIKAGKEAIDTLRSGVVRELYRKASSGKTETGGLMFSGRNFGKALKAIGNQKLKTLFDDETLTFFGQLQRIGELRMPTTGSALGLGPSGRGAAAITEAVNDLADQAAGRWANLTRKLFKVKEDFSDLGAAVDPAGATASAIGAAQRVRIRPRSGSIGAVTADRLTAGSEG